MGTKLIQVFAEAFYYNEKDADGLEKARLYLKMWSENLLFKLKRETYHAKVCDEHFIERNSQSIGATSLYPYAVLALKLSVEFEFNHGIGPVQITEPFNHTVKETTSGN